MRSQRDISDKWGCRPHAAGHFSRKCIYRYQVFIILEILTANLLCCTGTAVSHCCIENLSKIEITGLLSRLVCMIIWHPDQLPVIFDYFWARNTFLTTDLHGKSTQTLIRLFRRLCHNRPVQLYSCTAVQLYLSTAVLLVLVVGTGTWVQLYCSRVQLYSSGTGISSVPYY